MCPLWCVDEAISVPLEGLYITRQSELVTAYICTIKVHNCSLPRTRTKMAHLLWSLAAAYLDPKLIDESSPGVVLSGLCRRQGLGRHQLVAVYPAPGRNVMHGPRVCRHYLKRGASRQVSHSVLCSDHRQGAQ